MNKFDDINFKDFPGLPRMHFKGSSSTTTKNIPAQTAEEKALQDSSASYASSAMGTANNLLGNTNAVANNFNNVYDNYNNTSKSINNGYTSLLNGQLPSTYAQARQQALSADLNSTIGTKFNNLNSRGIFGNSSITRSAMNDISRNASDSLARSFASDMSGYAGILGNAASNNNSNLGNYGELITALLGNSNTAANNTSDLFKTMYNGRYNAAGTTTKSNDGGSSTAGLVGSLGSAAILCFAGGTKISIPGGYKPIEDIRVGDKVLSSSGVETVTYVQEPCISNDEYMTVSFEDKEVTTTAMQTFIIEGNDILAKDLPHIPAETVTVYDFSTTGPNTYFASGFLVRGA